jgi:hypothetical protein
VTETAGQRLRRDIDAALAHAVGQHGPMEFDEVERLTIDRAAAAADRAEVLQRLFDAELAGPQRSSALTRLSAEARQLDRTALELARTVAGNLGATPKSDRHVRAVRSRWDRTPRHAGRPGGPWARGDTLRCMPGFGTGQKPLDGSRARGTKR